MNLAGSTTAVTDGALFADFGSLAQLRGIADQDADAALGEVAQHFESLFVQMMLKSMREATETTSEGGLFNSQEMKFHQGMFDQQMSLHLSQSGGIGLAPIIERQLAGPKPVAGGELHSLERDWLQAAQRRPLAPSAPVAATAPATLRPEQGDFAPADQQQFVRQLWPHAQRAAAALGVEPEVLVAQAALESGWGQKVIRGADGSNSYNLFAIKAGGQWQGERVQVGTLEYRDGVAQRERASFRAYQNLAAGVDDYVQFLQQPRYRQALASGGDSRQFLTALQRAGYATDPQYAAKISRVMAGDEFRAQVAELKSATVARLHGLSLD